MSPPRSDITGPSPIARLAAVRAYAAPPLPCPVDLRLDGNEGSWPDAALLRDLAPRARALLHAYPDAAALEATLAARHGAAADACIVTAGADEALDRICRAFADPRGNAILPEPTFAMLPRYLALAGTKVHRVAWPAGPYPTSAVLATVDPATQIVFVVSPNNPTGAVATRTDLKRLALAAPRALLVVDAAYAEFADDDITDAALAMPNAVVTRTFSKAWGLAGCRVGYVLGPPAVIAALRATASPYPVAGPSLAMARARLDDAADVAGFVVRVRHEVAALRQQLEGLGVDVPTRSQANFVFARHPQAARVRDLVAGLGVAIRAFPGDPRLGDALRITCPGDAAAFARLSHALHTALRPQALLLDMDGVLADVSGSYRQAIVATARTFGVVLTGEDVAAAKREGSANDDWDLTWRLVRARGAHATLAEVTAAFERLYQGEGDVPGLWRNESLLVDRATLSRWAQRLPLAVVTGRPRADAARFLEHHAIADLFAAVVCREDGPLKPDPAPVRLALQRLRVDTAWMLGDTVDDVRAARAAGVLPLGVRPPGDPDPDLAAALHAAGAPHVLDRTADLDRLLP